MKAFLLMLTQICYHEVIKELLPYVSHANLEMKQHNRRKDQVKFVEYKIKRFEEIYMWSVKTDHFTLNFLKGAFQN